MKPAQLDLVDVCANRHQGADTSVQAFESTPKKKRKSQRLNVLRLLNLYPRSGFTTDEIAKGLGIPYTSASARMAELKAIGAIKDSGKRRKTSHGKTARVMIVVSTPTTIGAN
jgi:predicted transcriptional regulator